MQISAVVLGHLCLYLVMTTATILLVYTCIAPALAGRNVRRKLQKLLEVQSGLLQGIATLAASPYDALTMAHPKTAGQELVDNDQGGPRGENSLLNSKLLELYRMEYATNGLQMLIGSGLAIARFEIDLYRRPRRCPVGALRSVADAIGAINPLCLRALGAVEDTAVIIDKPHRLQPQLQAVAGAFTVCSKAAGECLTGGRYSAVLDALARLEAASSSLFEAQQGTPGGSRTLVNAALQSAAQLHHACLELSEVVVCTLPDSQAAADKHARQTVHLGWVEAIQKGQNSAHMEALEAGAVGPRPQSKQPARSIAIDGMWVQGKTGVLKSMRKTLIKVSDRTGIRPWHLALSLQMALTMAAAAPIMVCTVPYNAFDKHTVWLLLAIVVIAEAVPSSVLDHGALRAVGLTMAIPWSFALAGLAALVNGLSPDNQPGKLITVGILQPVFLAFCAYQSMAMGSRWWRIWQTAGVGTIIMVLMPLEEVEPRLWTALSIRIGLIAIAFVLEFLSSALVFPVTAETHLKEQSMAAMVHLARMAQDIGDVLDPLGAPGGKAPSPQRRSPKFAGHIAILQNLEWVMDVDRQPAVWARLMLQQRCAAFKNRCQGIGLALRRAHASITLLARTCTDSEAGGLSVDARELVVDLMRDRAACLLALRSLVLGRSPDESGLPRDAFESLLYRSGDVGANAAEGAEPVVAAARSAVADIDALVNSVAAVFWKKGAHMQSILEESSADASTPDLMGGGKLDAAAN